MTVEAWINPTNWNNAWASVYNHPTKVGFEARTGGGFAFWICDADCQEAYTLTPIPTATWSHVAGVYNSTSQQSTLYVNGVLVGGPTAQGPPASGTGNPSIGHNPYDSSAARWFTGSIDELAVYNRALSNEEILARYNRQAGYFSSRIIDTGASSSWSTLAWTPSRPLLKELPGNAATESGYSTGNVDMTGNVLLLHMNEASGTLTDASGNNNNGTQSGGVTYSAPGKYGGTALRFDGIDDKVTMPNSASLDITGSMTVEAWINPTNWNNVWGSVYAQYPKVSLEGRTGGGFAFWICDADCQEAYTLTPIPTATWSHVAGVYNSTSQQVTLYVNGVLVGGPIAQGPPASRTESASIGHNPYDSSAARWFTGSIDEVAVYNRALTATEVADRYKRGGVRLKFQARSCNDAACSGENFVGPAGTTSDYYSELSNATTSTPSLSLTNFGGNNRYFQYRAYLETDNASFSPELTSVTIGPAHTSDQTITISDVSVSESAGTATVTVSMASTGDANTTVDYATSNGTAMAGSDYTATSGTLTWTAGQTGDKTFTVSITNDSADENDETINITLSNAVNGTISDSSGVVTITDDDATPTVTFSSASQSGAEGVGTMVFNATLSAASGKDVTVPFTMSGTATGGGTDYSVTSSPLTISAGSTSATVTITVVNDALDENDETVIVTMGTPTNATQGATTVHTATITDDDATPTVTFSSSSQSGAESVGTMTFNATLSAASGRNVTVPFTMSGTATGGGTDYSVTSSPLTISAGSTSATVTITVVNDALDENDETVIVTMGTPTNATQGATTVHTATITDNDTAGVTITQSGGSTDVTEGGATDTYTVVLTSEPTANVTITITTNTQVGVSNGTATFTTANWNTAQTITVSAVNDNVMEGNHTSTITHAATSADSNYNGIGIGNVTANIVDNDTAGVSVVQTGGETNVGEAGTTDTYTIVLTTEPTANVTIAITPGTQVTTDKATLLFTAANWNTAQTITASAINDNVMEGNHTSTITHAAMSGDSNYNGIGIGNVTANIVDNDTAGVSITQTGGATNVAEAGTTDTYIVILTSEPTADVTIAVTPGAQVTTDKATLVFTAANWNTVQTITVSAVNDNVAEGNHASTITHAVTSTDSNYNGIGIGNVTANIVDNDTAGVSIAQTGGATNVGEDGTTDTYTVVLTTQPTANVIVTITTDSQAGADKGTVTFTAANWNTAQTVTVSAIADNFVEGNHASTITHAVTSTDSNYNGIGAASVLVNITDNDQAGVTVTQTGGATTAAEGGATDTYTVVLTGMPSAGVTITINPGAQLAATPSLLTFTAANWNVAQTVTVSAVDDSTVEGNHSGTIAHTVASTDSNYNGLIVSSVAVSITDNDEAAAEEAGEEEDGETGGGGDTTPVADAGDDQIVKPGTSLTLDGGDSTGSNLGFSWEIVLGCGVLASADDTKKTIIYMSLPSCRGDVVVRLKVTDGDGDTDDDLVTLHLFDNADVYGVVLDDHIVWSSGGETAIEKRTDDDRLALQIAGKEIVLPEDGGEDYSLAVTHDGFAAIGVPENDGARGEVYVATTQLASLAHVVDLEVSALKLGTNLALSEGVAAETVGGLAASVAGFASITGNTEKDQFGAFLSTGDINHDGTNELLIGAPGAGRHGVVYVYSLDLDLIATIFGSEENPVTSTLVADYLAGSEEDIFFGPNNRALNSNLRRQDKLSGGDMTVAGLMLAGYDDFGGNVDFAETDPDLLVDTNNLNQSAAFGDLDSDGDADLVLVADSGNAYVFFGPIEDATVLAVADANVVITGGSPDTGFGRSVAIGDVTGDGKDDLVVGAPDYGDLLQGAVYVVFGRSSWESTVSATTAPHAIVVTGESEGDQIGSDILLDDRSGDDGVDEIYTLAGDETYEINLLLLSSDEPSEEPGEGISGGGGCGLRFRSR